MVYMNILLMREKLGRYAQLLHGTLLDLGAGTKPYRGFFDVERYVGANALKYYQPNVPDDVRANTDVWIGDACALPFCDRAFDGVVSFQVLSAIDQPGRFFAELARVVTAGGYLLLTTDFLYPKWAASDCLRHTDGSLRALAQAHGFDVVTVESFGGFWTALHCCAMRYVRDYPQRIYGAPTRGRRLWHALLYLCWLVSMPAWAMAGHLMFCIERGVVQEYSFTTNLLMVARRRRDLSQHGA